VSLESLVEVEVEQVPRHYVVKLSAAVTPLDMIDLLQGLAQLKENGMLGTFLAAVEDACAEAYTADLPQAVQVPVPDDGEEPEGGAKVTAE
jgi:hypothetical protein